MPRYLPSALKTLLLSFCLSISAALAGFAASNGAPDLDMYLSLQRLIYPSAVVSASFYEWRDVSQYRGTAGLHLGYDIAMPAGTAAIAGWPGQVTRVAQWYGPEYGITVLSPSGFETTYGHLAPRVKVGDVVNAGDTVGMVVNDHVDIKMRGPDGAYFDFGHSTPPAAGTFPMPVPVRPTREGAMQAYQTAWYSMQLDKEELRVAKSTEASAAAELAELQARVRKSRAELPKMKQFLADGLVARLDVQKAQADVSSGTARIAALQKRLRDAQRDVGARQMRVRSLETQLEMAARLLASMGIGKAEVEKKLRAPTSPTAVAQARELQLMRKRTLGPKVDAGALQTARAEVKRMDALYEEGVVSRMERDRVRARYDAIRKGLQ